jgi:hypothetical protein
MGDQQQPVLLAAQERHKVDEFPTMKPVHRKPALHPAGMETEKMCA